MAADWAGKAYFKADTVGDLARKMTLDRAWGSSPASAQTAFRKAAHGSDDPLDAAGGLIRSLVDIADLRMLEIDPAGAAYFLARWRNRWIAAT